MSVPSPLLWWTVLQNKCASIQYCFISPQNMSLEDCVIRLERCNLYWNAQSFHICSLQEQSDIRKHRCLCTLSSKLFKVVCEKELWCQFSIC